MTLKVDTSLLEHELKIQLGLSGLNNSLSCNFELSYTIASLLHQDYRSVEKLSKESQVCNMSERNTRDYAPMKRMRIALADSRHTTRAFHEDAMKT